MSSSFTRCLALSVALLIAACGDAPEARVGIDLTEVQYEFFDEREGVHPSTVVLKNPNNPFREVGVDSEAKFRLTDESEDEVALATNAARFYAWATVLAVEATGVNQFFAADALREAYLADEVSAEDREALRVQAIAGFQSLLDNFPEALLFNADEKGPLSLATLSLERMLDVDGLNAEVEGGWVLVLDNEGRPVAVQQTDVPTEEFQ